jgi:hypothetical protein
MARLIILNALPLNAFPFRSFNLVCVRYKLEELNEFFSYWKEIVPIKCYIRHEGTVKVLNEYFGLSLVLSSDLYQYQQHDKLVIVTLKSPIRGKEVQEVRLEDLDIVVCDVVIP